jgi:hypothetical protein
VAMTSNEFNYSSLVLVQGGGEWRNVCEFMATVNASDENELLLSLEITPKKNHKKVGKSLAVEYFDEKQMIELYHYLKSALVVKYPNI